MTQLFNPFHKIAGYKAFVLGTLIAALTIFVSLYSHSLFDGVIDFHKASYTNYWPYLTFYLISWICLIFYFGLAGILWSRTKFRWIDLVGTTLLSRFPLLIVAILAFAIPFYNHEQLSDISKIHFSVSFLIASGISLLCIIWTVALYYNSYRVSLNIKGARAVWSFITVLVLAEITSLIILRSLHF